MIILISERSAESCRLQYLFCHAAISARHKRGCRSCRGILENAV